mmetsp:Transcript_5550/g.9925  ORF Transcript_5550/g.9925 Transcript_5550/m.9925 type:complete len:288 (+) Transcript_5550:794-1657(+)
MRAGRVLVHVGAGGLAGLVPFVQGVHHLLLVAARHHLHVRDLHTGLLRVPDVQFVAAPNQVVDDLVVHLNHRNANLGRVLRLALVNDVEQLPHRAEVDPPIVGGALHRVGLPTAGLPIREDAHVEPIQHGDGQGLHVIEDLLLPGVGPVAHVELEGVGLAVAVVVDLDRQSVLSAGGDASSRLLLLGIRRLQTAEDADVPLQFLKLVEVLPSHLLLLLVLLHHVIHLMLLVTQGLLQGFLELSLLLPQLLQLSGHAALGVAQLLLGFDQLLVDLRHGDQVFLRFLQL